MIPAKTHCPTNWTLEYNGILVREHISHYRSMYECVDKTPESVQALNSAVITGHCFIQLRQSVMDCLVLPMVLRKSLLVQFALVESTKTARQPKSVSGSICIHIRTDAGIMCELVCRQYHHCISAYTTFSVYLSKFPYLCRKFNHNYAICASQL